MQSDDLGLVDSLRAWLIKRSGPDSGIGYEGGDFDWDRLRSRQARVTLHGSDADFIAQNFHGDGAAALLAAIERLVAERDEAREACAEALKQIDAAEGLMPEVEAIEAQRDKLKMALRQIADLDEVESALDPEWTINRARQALKDAP